MRVMMREREGARIESTPIWIPREPVGCTSGVSKLVKEGRKETQREGQKLGKSKY